MYVKQERKFPVIHVMQLVLRKPEHIKTPDRNEWTDEEVIDRLNLFGEASVQETVSCSHKLTPEKHTGTTGLTQTLTAHIIKIC